MKKHVTCCVWCLKKCHTSKPPKITEDTVCSDKCKGHEIWFRHFFSDEIIGLRNYETSGINPNHRGGKCTALKRNSKSAKGGDGK